MSPGREANLLAICLPRVAAAPAIAAAWDQGEAVVVLDPDAPSALTEHLLTRLRPTHLLDSDGRRECADGVPTTADVRAVVTTSGTTGAPKAAELTAAGLEAMARGWAGVLDLQPRDHWLVCVPLHHVVGQGILARARVIGAAVTVHPAFDVAAVAAFAAGTPSSDEPKLVSLVPTMLQRLLDAGAPLDHFRRVLIGGAPLSSSLRERATAARVPTVEGYGLTETWGGAVADGLPLDGVEVMLTDDHEVLVRGAVVMRGYRLEPEATAAAFTPSGWLRTGDIGRLDERGRLQIVDRKRDLVISGGVNVSPSTVEAVLAEHPAVAEVCVTGAADDEWGERVVAYVVPRDAAAPPTLDALRAFARDRLSAPELPREVVMIDTVPRSSSGKVLRHELGTAK